MDERSAQNIMFNNKSSLLVVIFFIALIARCGWAYYDYRENGMSNWVDAKNYYERGLEFADGNFYDKVLGSGPFVPLIVALAKVVTGDPIWPVLFLNCLLSSLAVFVLFRLGERLVHFYAGYGMAIWYTFHHVAMRYNFQILKEPFLLLLLPLMILLLVRIHDHKETAFNVVLSSLVFSVLIHTDERYIVYGPFILAFILLSNKGRIGLKQAGIWLAILIITMLPWTLRNYRQYGELVILTPRTTAFTSKFWGTDIANLHFSNDETRKSITEARKAEAYQAARQYGVQPRLYGRYERYYKAFIHYWQPTHFRLTFIQDGFRPVKSSLLSNLNGIFFYGIFLPFYLAGLVLAIVKRNGLMLFLAILPLVHSLIHTIMIWPLGRYRFVMDFLVLIVALWFIKIYFGRLIHRARLKEDAVVS